MIIDKNMKVNLKEILDKEFPDERYSEECYLCDPNKNVSCSKEDCHINGGPCWHTTNKEFEKKQTNQDRLAEIIRKMDPKAVAKIWTNHTYVEDCSKCPANEYCNFPDELLIIDGKLLKCQDIFERWLQEE